MNYWIEGLTGGRWLKIGTAGSLAEANDFAHAYAERTGWYVRVVPS